MNDRTRSVGSIPLAAGVETAGSILIHAGLRGDRAPGQALIPLADTIERLLELLAVSIPLCAVICKMWFMRTAGVLDRIDVAVVFI